MKVQQATADGIKVIKEAGADEAVLTMKSLEALPQQQMVRLQRLLSHQIFRELQEA